MPDIILICVGKLKERFYSDASDEYQKRLKGFCNFSCIELLETKLHDNTSLKEIENALSAEGKMILKHLPDNALIISLCIEGKKYSSNQMADLISESFIRGISKIVFVVGGSFGLSDEIKLKSDIRLSMSDMTFPHHLARIMLLEQIYRSFQIIAGSKYHK